MQEKSSICTRQRRASSSERGKKENVCGEKSIKWEGSNGCQIVNEVKRKTGENAKWRTCGLKNRRQKSPKKILSQETLDMIDCNDGKKGNFEPNVFVGVLPPFSVLLAFDHLRWRLNLAGQPRRYLIDLSRALLWLNPTKFQPFGFTAQFASKWALTFGLKISALSSQIPTYTPICPHPHPTHADPHSQHPLQLFHLILPQCQVWSGSSWMDDGSYILRTKCQRVKGLWHLTSSS